MYTVLLYLMTKFHLDNIYGDAVKLALSYSVRILKYNFIEYNTLLNVEENVTS